MSLNILFFFWTLPLSFGELGVGGVGGGGGYIVNSGPFLRFSMSFEFLSEMFDHSVRRPGTRA